MGTGIGISITRSIAFAMPPGGSGWSPGLLMVSGVGNFIGGGCGSFGIEVGGGGITIGGIGMLGRPTLTIGIGRFHSQWVSS